MIVRSLGFFFSFSWRMFLYFTMIHPSCGYFITHRHAQNRLIRQIKYMYEVYFVIWMQYSKCTCFQVFVFWLQTIKWFLGRFLQELRQNQQWCWNIHQWWFKKIWLTVSWKYENNQCTMYRTKSWKLILCAILTWLSLLIQCDCLWTHHWCWSFSFLKFAIKCLVICR